MNENDKFRETLARIAEMASAAIAESTYSDENDSTDNFTQDAAPSCSLKVLPKRLLVAAARKAIEINPVNAPVFGPLATVGADVISDPQRAAVVTAKYWGPIPRTLSVSFMEPTPSDLRRRIVSHMNAWTKTGGIQFAETQGAGRVRISRGPTGYWSYLGTDITLIPQNEPTMNLQAFTMSTPESEFRRVVRHETGHTMGMPHEHMRREFVARIDPQRAYEYFRRTQGWDRATVDQQVLSSLDEGSILGTPADETSIMCYHLPGTITRDGRPIVGGLDINQTDFEFVGRIYPRPGQSEFASDFDQEDDYAVAS